MEVVLIVEVCVFTVALCGDVDIGVLYVIEVCHSLDFSYLGMLVAAQAVAKIAGLVVAKVVIYYMQVKHGVCIALCVLNYILYYTVLVFASTKPVLAAAMFVNVFGPLAFPSILSFIKVNLHETAEIVLDCSAVLSFTVATIFGALKLSLYQKTRTVFPGASFALVASLLLISGVLLGASYLTSSVKSQRKSKNNADKLLNEHR